MPDGRKTLTAALTTLCIAATAGPALTAAPAAAAPHQPTIAEAKTRVQHLSKQEHLLAKRHRDTGADLSDARLEFASTTVVLRLERDHLGEFGDQVTSDVMESYPTPASPAGQTQPSANTEAFLNELDDVATFTPEQRSQLQDLARDIDRLKVRRTLAKKMVHTLTAEQHRLAERQRVVHQQRTQAAQLLDRLEERREERLSRSEERTTDTSSTPTVAASGGAATAVQYALAQVGDAYVYGAAGPDAYDCSGLTMAAWGSAGVSLPHSSSGQMGYGTPVSTSALQPGDLVFYYSPVSHVAMYIGNGQIVHAANPGTGVVVSPMSSMPIAGAVRPG